jgi:calcineurin-like phosphoesterase family protein
LPGTKILVRGNHDKRTDHWYEGHGWMFCCSSILLTRFGKRILLTHRPFGSQEWFDLNVHGHNHNTVPKDHMISPNNYCLCLENENYEPVLLESLIDRVNKILC